MATTITATFWLVLAAGACTAVDAGDDMGGPGEPGEPGQPGEPEPEADPCETALVVPVGGRAVTLMPDQKLAEVAARVPCVVPGAVRDALESAGTYWYDKNSLTPGYQDSFGDNVVTPIGMRPNTIDPGLINLAVPGGHQQILVSHGVFHFPFGQPIGAVTNVEVVDFWQPPTEGAIEGGAPLPVVYWQRDPNSYTHRVEWMFPAGTLFGELLFMVENGERHPFEIRTRRRTLAGWDVDVYRPFPTADSLADAIEARRGERSEWASSSALDALVEQLRGTVGGGDAGGLSAYRVAATHFVGAFPARDAGRELLPALAGADAELIHELLRTTPFRSARGIAWKEANGLTAWAAGAAGAGSIVPRGFNAAAFEVSEQSCDTCHRDAGRPFETWYDNILAYGELWGNDETFTWHPFTESRFVDGQGRVVNFNYDNRQIRPDFVNAGLVAPYRAQEHPATTYKRIVREWTDFAY